MGMITLVVGAALVRAFDTVVELPGKLPRHAHAKGVQLRLGVGGRVGFFRPLQAPLRAPV